PSRSGTADTGPTWSGGRGNGRRRLFPEALCAAALRDQLPKAIPHFRPDVVGELSALLRKHAADVRCVETRHAPFRNHVLEMDPRFLDHGTQGTGTATALADGERQQVEIARAIQALAAVLRRGHARLLSDANSRNLSNSFTIAHVSRSQ